MDINNLIEGIKKLLDYMFGSNVPTWLFPTISWIVGIGLILAGLVFLLGLLKKLWVEFVQPAFYKQEDIRRRYRRQRFADHVESEIRRLNTLESWNDNRFTELEAEVEAEGEQRIQFLFSQKQFSTNGLRREKSLSAAIEHSQERLVLLEGDPGSGKSVALKHVAQTMAARVRDSKNLKTRIPVYVNLKHIRRDQNQKIDRKLIEEFIFQTLNRVNDRDIDEYLGEEFRRGLNEGTWFFLFDSFDEIPEILSSTNTDDTIRQYADAVRDFLHGMNNCRGIVASREYKGPRFLGWPKFRVLPLTFRRMSKLVELTRMPFSIQKSVKNGIIVASQEFRLMTSNPMFMNLICEYMNTKQAPEFPQNIQVVFEEYLKKRMTRDEERVKQRFNKTPQEIREAAEKLAFCMTADNSIGLSPSLVQLERATKILGLDLGDNFEISVRALEYLKLARIDKSSLDDQETFSFAHRRFQEFFATAIILREPKRISLDELLTNGRWRETVVVMLQTLDDQSTTPVLQKANEILLDFTSALKSDIVEYERSTEASQSVSLPSYRTFILIKSLFEPWSVSIKKIKNYFALVDKDLKSEPSNQLKKPHSWPLGLYHLLSIIQDGSANKNHSLDKIFQDEIDRTLRYFAYTGDIIDAKWSIELAGSGSSETLLRLIRSGFAEKRILIREAAFRQVFRLTEIPLSISSAISNILMKMTVDDELFRNRNEIYAFLSRLSSPEKLLDTARLLAWLPWLDKLLTILGLAIIYNKLPFQKFFLLTSVMLFLLWVKWHSGKVLASISVREIFQNDIYLVAVSILPLMLGMVIIEPSPQEISKFIGFISLSSGAFWGIVFATSGKLIKKYYWAFYWLIWPLFVAGIDFLAQSTIPKRNIIMVGNWFLGALVFLIVFTGIDGLYLASRANIIFNEMKNRKIKFEKLVGYLMIKESSNWMAGVLGLSLVLGAFILTMLILVQLGEMWILLTSNYELYCIFNVVVLVIGFIFFRPAYRYASGFVKYTRWEIDIYNSWKKIVVAKENLTTIGFVKEVEKSNSTIVRVRIINDALINQMVSPTKENEEHLRVLISYVDSILKSGDAKEQTRTLQKIDPELEKTIKKPWKENKKKKQKMAGMDDWWNAVQLTELCKLYEQVRALSQKGN